MCKVLDGRAKWSTLSLTVYLLDQDESRKDLSMFRRRFNKTIILLKFVEYEIFISNSASTSLLSISSYPKRAWQLLL